MDAKDATIIPLSNTQAAGKDAEPKPTEGTEASTDTLLTTEQGVVSNQMSPQPTVTEEQDPQILTNQIPDWVAHCISQVLADRPAEDIPPNSSQVLQENLLAILREAQEKREFPRQEIIEKVYKTLVENILGKSKKPDRPNKKGRRSNQKNVKRKKKRYLYARTQEFYKKDPGALATYTREGIPWPDDQEAIFQPGVTKHFYTELWGKASEVTTPFERVTTSTDEASQEAILRTITAKEPKDRINSVKNESAPGPDGTRMNHIVYKATQVLRLFYNLPLICRNGTGTGPSYYRNRAKTQ